MFDVEKSYVIKNIENEFNHLREYTMGVLTNLDDSNESNLGYDLEMLGYLHGKDYTYLQLVIERAYQDYFENKNNCYSYDDDGNVIAIPKEDGYVTPESLLVHEIMYPYFCIRAIDFDKVGYYYNNEPKLSFEYMNRFFDTIYNVYVGYGDNTHPENVIYPILDSLDEKSFTDFYLYTQALFLAYIDNRVAVYKKMDIFAKELKYDPSKINVIAAILDHYKKEKEEKIKELEECKKKQTSRSRKNTKNNEGV